MTFEIGVERMDFHLFKDWVILTTRKMKAHMGPGALAVSGEWALSTDLRGLVPARVHAKLLQSCLTLCDAMDCSPPGSFVHGIIQARIMESVAISFSRGSSGPRDKTQVSCIAQILYRLSHLKPASGPLEVQQMNHHVTDTCIACLLAMAKAGLPAATLGVVQFG